MNVRLTVARLLTAVCLTAICLTGCKPNDDAASTEGGGSSDTPTFKLAWSEYPSWSVFGVAHEMGLVDAAEGEMGEIEKKHGVDLVLVDLDYGACMNAFTTGNCDAVCITNMDALILSPNRAGVAILPTSTSNGADACIVTGIDSLEELKAHKIYGMKESVSEYCFVRCIEEAEKAESKGYKAEDFQFTNQDPGAAAAAMAQNQESHRAIMVWNPFVLQTLKDRPDAKVLFDSSKIPGEIVDMVVAGQDVAKKPGADKFFAAVIDTFYRMNEELAKPDTGDKALVALGEKFSNLGLEEMKEVVKQTQFYKTPAEATALLTSPDFQQTMETVKKFCVDQGIVKDPQFGFGSDAAGSLIFDASYLELVETK